MKDGIKRKMYHGDFFKKKAVKTGSKNIHDAYKRARNDLNKGIQRETISLTN